MNSSAVAMIGVVLIALGMLLAVIVGAVEISEVDTYLGNCIIGLLGLAAGKPQFTASPD